MDMLHTEKFVDMAPRAVHAALLEEGIYLCSPRTMYRLLAASGEIRIRPRRQSETKPRFARPELLATKPNGSGRGTSPGFGAQRKASATRCTS
jgi:putative transposase